MGEWYRFVDLDADGDLDLLAEQPFSNIRFYRNTGTRQARDSKAGGTLIDTDGKNIYLDRRTSRRLSTSIATSGWISSSAGSGVS